MNKLFTAGRYMLLFSHETFIIRSFNDSDAEAFTQASLESVETVGKWMDWCHSGFDKSNALDWFASCRRGFIEKQAYEFGVFSKESDELLGGIGLNSINYQHLFCNLGYWVRQSAQGKGVASTALRFIAPYAFNSLRMRRVEIVVANGNIASESVAKKSGALYEGVARNRLYLHGNSVDASIFSLIPTDIPP